MEARARTSKVREPGLRTDADGTKECCFLAFSAKLQLLSMCLPNQYHLGDSYTLLYPAASMRYNPDNLWNWFHVFPEKTLPKRWCLIDAGFFLAITNF